MSEARPSPVLGYLLLTLAFVAAAGALFFGYYGVQLVYLAATFEGEGSLGHVGMYIAAIVFPFIALIAAAVAWISWKAGKRRLNTYTK
jgi:hypothetical protein